ncbi:hypothetical protein BC828DRAFT_380607 [Blastocladiella britannica]|nr:hypothetical protein BC828DRAFT_380607 [Blastocladiella britannica]
MRPNTSTSVLLTLVAASNFIVAARAASTLQCFGDGAKICYAATPTSYNGTTVDMLIKTTVRAGWISIGIGAGMDATDMIFAWPTIEPIDNLATWNLVRRWSTGYSKPDFAPEQNLQLISTTELPDEHGYHHLVVRRPVASSGTGRAADKQLVDTDMDMSWAVYESGFRTVSLASFPSHDSAGRFQYNSLKWGSADAISQLMATTATTTVTPLPAMVPRKTSLVVHACCMASAMTFWGPMNVFFARYLKFLVGPGWYHLHAGGIAIPMLLLAATGVSSVASTSVVHFSTNHSKVAITVLSCTLLQATAGAITFRSIVDRRTRTRFTMLARMLHRRLGYLVVCGAIVTMCLGHIMLGSNSIIFGLNITWVSLIACAFVVAEVYRRKALRAAMEDTNLLLASAAASPTK